MRNDEEAAKLLDIERRYGDEFARARARSWTPMYLYDEMRPSWKVAMPMYVMHCAHCDRYTVTYPAGYQAKIRCDGCRGYAIVREHAIEHPMTPFQATLYLLSQRLRSLVQSVRESLGLNDDPRQPPPRE